MSVKYHGSDVFPRFYDYIRSYCFIDYNDWAENFIKSRTMSNDSENEYMRCIVLQANDGLSVRRLGTLTFCTDIDIKKESIVGKLVFNKKYENDFTNKIEDYLFINDVSVYEQGNNDNNMKNVLLELIDKYEAMRIALGNENCCFYD